MSDLIIEQKKCEMIDNRKNVARIQKIIFFSSFIAPSFLQSLKMPFFVKKFIVNWVSVYVLTLVSPYFDRRGTMVDDDWMGWWYMTFPNSISKIYCWIDENSFWSCLFFRVFVYVWVCRLMLFIVRENELFMKIFFK